jgi:sulfoxide reductase heme-binding subunit YedZ
MQNNFYINPLLNKFLIFFIAVMTIYLIKTFFKYQKKGWNFINLLSLASFAILPIALASISLIYPDFRIFKLFGQAAQLLLIYLLFIKPLGVVFNIKFFQKQLSFRRQYGLASFWLAFFHFLNLFFAKRLFNLGFFINTNSYLFYGALAISSMLIVALTSNDFSMKKLRKNWKTVQRFAYPSLFLVLIHSGLAEKELEKVFVVGGAYLILKILEFSKVKIRLPF